MKSVQMVVAQTIHYARLAPAGGRVHLFTHKPGFYAKLGFHQTTCTTLTLLPTR